MMKRIVIMSLLLMSTNVFAEWVAVSSNPDEGVIAYIDLQSIQKNGHKSTAWALFDYNKIQTNEDVKFLSTVSRNEYDCLANTILPLDVHFYSKNMRGGSVVYSLSNIEVKPTSTVPGSMFDTYLKIACGKQ